MKNENEEKKAEKAEAEKTARPKAKGRWTLAKPKK